MKRMINKNIKYLYLLLFIPLFGCAVGPNFVSPALNIPDKIEGDTLPRDLIATEQSSKWWQRFGDEYLDTLVTRALEANKDVNIAKNRVEIALLNYRSSRAALAPNLGIKLEGEGNYNHTTKIVQSYSATPVIGWELDIFGGGRRKKEMAYSAAMSSEYEYFGVMLKVVSDVAQSYFSLLEYSALLDISQKNYLTRKKSYELMKQKFIHGAISRVVLNQSKTLMIEASIAVYGYKNAITQVSISLSQLLGENPRRFNVSDSAIFNLKTPDLPPKIMPAWLLNKRPDIMASYYNVWQSSANIGVAVSKRFPTVSLDVDGGVLYNIIKGTVTKVPFIWNGTLSFAQSLLNFGINKRNVDIARLNNQIEILAFENNVISAFGEVQNVMSQIVSYTNQEREYSDLVASNLSINELNEKMYLGGVTNYFNVLDSEKDLFDSQIQYINILSSKLISYTTLYKAVGGSW